MVFEVVLGKNRYYGCSECFLIYEDRETASTCEEWCARHKSCNSEITSKSIGYVKFVRGPEISLG